MLESNFQFIFFVLCLTCFSGLFISGLLIVLDKWRVLRYLWNNPCYFCITFWLTLIICAVIGIHAPNLWFVSFPIALGSASLSRFLISA